MAKTYMEDVESFMPSEEYIAEFTDLMFKKKGIRLSREEAIEQGTKLLDLVRILLKPLKDSELAGVAATFPQK